MRKETPVVKDEEKQQPIPTVWRKSLWKIAEALRVGDYQLGDRIAGVRQLSPADAQRISRNIETYGAQLTSLPESTWDTSVCQWMGSYWDALVDLYTLEEGASDLVLFVHVYESGKGYNFEVHSVHVP